MIFILLLILYFALPFEITGFYFVKMRVIPFLYLFGILIIMNTDYKVKKKGVKIISGMLISAFIIFNIYFCLKCRVFNKKMQSFEKIIQEIPEKKKILPLTFDPRDKYMIRTMPFWHVSHIYNIKKGGFNPSLFTIEDYLTSIS